MSPLLAPPPLHNSWTRISRLVSGGMFGATPPNVCKGNAAVALLLMLRLVPQTFEQRTGELHLSGITSYPLAHFMA